MRGCECKTRALKESISAIPNGKSARRATKVTAFAFRGAETPGGLAREKHSTQHEREGERLDDVGRLPKILSQAEYSTSLADDTFAAATASVSLARSRKRANSAKVLSNGVVLQRSARRWIIYFGKESAPPYEQSGGIHGGIFAE